MNYRIFIIIFHIILLTGCEQNNLSKNVVNQEKLSKYKNSGFALVYDNVLKKDKKIVITEIEGIKENVTFKLPIF